MYLYYPSCCWFWHEFQSKEAKPQLLCVAKLRLPIRQNWFSWKSCYCNWQCPMCIIFRIVESDPQNYLTWEQHLSVAATNQLQLLYITTRWLLRIIFADSLSGLSFQLPYLPYQLLSNVRPNVRWYCCILHWLSLDVDTYYLVVHMDQSGNRSKFIWFLYSTFNILIILLVILPI